MLKVFTEMKLKHKLLGICILPFVVQMFFVGEILWKNYEVVQQKQTDEDLIHVFERAGALIPPLNQELDLSIMKIKGFEDVNQSDLIQARKTSDGYIQELDKELHENVYTSGGHELSYFFQNIVSSSNELTTYRERVDSGKITVEELIQYYTKLEETLVDDLAEIAKGLSDLEVSRSMFAYINLLFEEIAVGDEKRIVYLTLHNGEVTPADIRELSYYIGQKKAYEKTFLELGSNSEDELYRQAMRESTTSESTKLIEKILNAPAGTKLEENPRTWWETESNKLKAMEMVQKTIITDMRENISRERQRSVNELLIIIGSILIVIPLAIYLLFYSLKKIVRKLQEEIVILSKSGNDIKSSITEATSGTAETASSVTETTTTVEELKQTAQVAAEKAKNVAEVSKEATNILSTGEKSLEKTIDGMLRIQNGMSTISDSIIKLSEHSQSIGKIIDTVNELAEQSHLLAVNAAIEAAKAGEQGKGFSVVAQEVRTLAEQSKQATIQVRSILNDIQNSTSAAVMATEQGTKAVNNGVELSKEISNSMKTLSEGISKVTDATTQIESSSDQQLIGVKQVNVAMSNIRDATEKHLDHMHQIEKSMEGMNAVGNALKDLVSKL